MILELIFISMNAYSYSQENQLEQKQMYQCLREKLCDQRYDYETHSWIVYKKEQSQQEKD